MREYVSLTIVVNSKTAKGQSFYRRLLKRQNAIMSGFSVTRFSVFAR